MELNDWLAIIGAFGGLEAVRWGVTFWVNHKTNTRKEDASADSMEDENIVSRLTGWKNASPSVTPRLMRYTLSFVMNSLISWHGFISATSWNCN